MIPAGGTETTSIDRSSLFTSPDVVRCAIYTRKSTEENLDNGFNSLDAQREAAEAFIESQRANDWYALSTQYNDPGFSGGTMERPALKRLLADIEAGLIDCVVVYKVDRLSRSLLDFTRLIETFDRHDVSFVSVTQQFNTTTSMGRLTLNMLLSFAQFEREVTAERIRDKVAASKRKGKWMGGTPPLGFDIDRQNKRLVVNEKEAELVRHIFNLFLELGSQREVVAELNSADILTKAWTTKAGIVRGGRPWTLGHLSRFLNNVTVIGKISHKGTIYEGEQDSIVELETWNRVHSILDRNRRIPKGRKREPTPALLKGLVRCGACGHGFGITYARKGRRRYRYYRCAHASKHGASACQARPVAASEIENIVVDEVRRLFQGGCLGLPSELLVLDTLWDSLADSKREHALKLLLERIEVHADCIVMRISLNGAQTLAEELQPFGNGRSDGTA